MTGRSYGDPCGIARSLDIVGERWALLVVRELLLGPKRFSDLMTGLTGASPNVISQRLRELSDDGVIEHRELPPPARVRIYELTPWGRELEPILLLLGRWGDHLPALENGVPSLDSLVLAIQGSARPPAVPGWYELRIGANRFTVRTTAIMVKIRREPAANPDAIVTTDEATLRAVCFGERTIADAEQSGDLTLTGSQAGIASLTALLLTLTEARAAQSAPAGG